jgi:FdhD protein
MVIKMAEQAGITLVGYVRGDAFEVYSHAQALAMAAQPEIH